MSLLAHLDKFPPFLCRLVARKNRVVALSAREIAQRSGLNLRIVSEMSRKTTWANTSVKNIEAFTKACGVDILRQRRARYYVKRMRAAHIFNANREQKKMLYRLFKLAASARQK